MIELIKSLQRRRDESVKDLQEKMDAVIEGYAELERQVLAHSQMLYALERAGFSLNISGDCVLARKREGTEADFLRGLAIITPEQPMSTTTTGNANNYWCAINKDLPYWLHLWVGVSPDCHIEWEEYTARRIKSVSCEQNEV